MDLSFLKNLGSMIGGGIKKGVGKLGEMEGADGEAALPMFKRPMPMTPGINPNAAMPSLKAPMIGGDSGTIGHDPRLRNPMPQLQRPGAPAIEPIRDSVNINATNSGPVGGSDTLGSLMDRMANAPAEVENQQTQMIGQRPIPVVRPPDFLGRKGATMDDTPLNHERYAYDNQYMKDGHHDRRWQDIAMTALHGANEGFKTTGDWRGALTGAGTGAAGAAISPLAARDFRFNKEQMPRLQAMQGETERLEDRKIGQRGKLAGIEHTEAQTRRINEPAPLPGYADAGWGTYNRATGKPEYIRPGGVSPTAAPRRYQVGGNLVDETGKVIYKGTPKPSAEQRPMTVSPGSTVIDPKTGREIYKAPPKEREMSKEAREAQSSVSQMKRDAAAAWSKARQEKDPAKRAELENNARYYQEEYNNAAIGLAEDFPDDFEAGDGEGGWSYFKPKGSTPTIKRGDGQTKVSRAAVEGFAKEKGISIQEAEKRFAAKGITVQ